MGAGLGLFRRRIVAQTHYIQEQCAVSQIETKSSPPRYPRTVKSLAIDFGEKRIGLALSDPKGRVAVATSAVMRSSDQQSIEAIQQVAIREQIERIIVGLPLSMDGCCGESAKRVRSFAKKLRRSLSMPIEFHNEALTSIAAEELIEDHGLKVKYNDSFAAQILLQEFLDQTNSESREV